MVPIQIPHSHQITTLHPDCGRSYPTVIQGLGSRCSWPSASGQCTPRAPSRGTGSPRRPDVDGGHWFWTTWQAVAKPYSLLVFFSSSLLEVNLLRVGARMIPAGLKSQPECVSKLFTSSIDSSVLIVARHEMYNQKSIITIDFPRVEIDVINCLCFSQTSWILFLPPSFPGVSDPESPPKIPQRTIPSFLPQKRKKISGFGYCIFLRIICSSFSDSLGDTVFR